MKAPSASAPERCKSRFHIPLLIASSMLVCQQAHASIAAAIDSIKVEFSKSDSTIARDREEDRVFEFTLQADKLAKDTSYTVSISVNSGKTTMAEPHYSLEVPFSKLVGTGEAQKRNFFVTIRRDTLSDRERIMVLDLKVKKASDGSALVNQGTRLTLRLTVKPAGPELTDYNYLAYIGTNFDLVDGVQAQNLFFAANVFVPRSTESKKGMFLSLYGNRAFTSIDSSSRVPWRTGMSPTSDSTYDAYFAQADRVTTFSSDNLGAYWSPFFGMGKLSDKDNGVQYHWAPSAEFIWRRITRATVYSDAVATDTVQYTGSLTTAFYSPAEYTMRENRYEFKVGPGVFISHDNERISVHIYASIGWSTVFIPQGIPTGIDGERDYARQNDVFFSGRAWITEPGSGLTLQAEVVNTYIDPKPYYVVTLSKAIGFKNLGKFFGPVTDR